MAVNITGAVRLPNDTLFASSQIIIKRSGAVVAQSNAVMLPEEWVVETDASGQVDFDIEPGSYFAFADTNAGRVQWSFNVAETPSSQEFETCVEAAEPTITPSLVAQAETAATAAQDAAEAIAGVQAFGAVGDGSTSDQAAFVAALAATTGPVYVPWTASYYVLSSLSESNRRRLYGPGEIRVGGVKSFISSEPWARNEDANIRAFNQEWQPSKWSSVDGSLYNGAIAVNMRRTGGFGTYGMGLFNLTAADATPSPEFDVPITSWLTHQNLTGGSGYGGWFGAIGPSVGLGQTFTGGSVIGSEINYGNRWGSQGLTVEPVNTRNHVGLKIVPDVIPSEDGPAFEAVTNITIASPGVITRAAHGYYNGMRLRIYARTGTLPGGYTDGGQYFVVGATTDTFQLSATFGGTAINTTGSFASGVAVLPSYPGDFGLAIGKSIWWHQHWTGIVIGADAIVPGGVSMRIRGGTTAAQAPGNAYVLEGQFSTGINTSPGTFVNNNAMFLGNNQVIRWNGDGRVTGNAGTIAMTTGNADSDGGLYANSFGVAAFVWDGTGGVPRIKFYDAVSPVGKQTVTGSRGSNAALADLLTKLANLGLITDSTT